MDPSGELVNRADNLFVKKIGNTKGANEGSGLQGRVEYFNCINTLHMWKHYGESPLGAKGRLCKQIRPLIAECISAVSE